MESLAGWCITDSLSHTTYVETNKLQFAVLLPGTCSTIVNVKLQNPRPLISPSQYLNKVYSKEFRSTE